MLSGWALRRCGVQPKLPPKRWTPGLSLVEAPARSASTRRLGDAMVIV